MHTRRTGGCAVALCSLLGCADAVSLAELPGEPDGLRMLLKTTVEGRPAEVVGVLGDQPLVYERLEDDERFHILSLSQEDLRNVHPAAALDPATVQQTDLGPLPNMECESLVSTNGDQFTTPMPAAASVMSLDPDEQLFGPPTVSATELVGSRALVMPLGVEPCRIPVAPSPLPIAGPFRTTGDGSRYASVYQVSESKVVAASNYYLYAYDTGEPERSFLVAGGTLRDFRLVQAVGFELSDRTIYVASLRTGDVPDLTGALAWFEDDGTTIRLLHHMPVDDLVLSLAVNSRGDLAATVGSSLLLGTVTSTAIQRTEFPGIGDLAYVSFSDDDEFIVSSRSIFMRLGYPGLGLIEQYKLQEEVARANGSRLSGVGFFDGDIFVSTFSQGTHRLMPGVEISLRIPLGIAQTVNPCNDNRSCNGHDTFRTISSMSLLPDPGDQDWVFFAHTRCSIVSALHANTGCTTDFAVESPSVVHARAHRLIIGGDNAIFEIRDEDLPQL